MIHVLVAGREYDWPCDFLESALPTPTGRALPAVLGRAGFLEAFEACVEGLIDGWVPDVGLRLTGPAALLRLRSSVVLSGPTGLAALLPQLPAVRAELVAGGASHAVPATFEHSSDRQSYRLVVQLAGQDVPAEGPVELRLSFAGRLPYFTPPGLYVNTRRFVVPAPARTELLRD